MAVDAGRWWGWMMAVITGSMGRKMICPVSKNSKGTYERWKSQGRGDGGVMNLLLEKYTHDDLVSIAASFLKGKMRCRPVFAEKSCWTTNERPDAFGVNSQGSVVVECKTSMSDFYADKRKPFRANPRFGMGRLRYYLTLPSIEESVRSKLPCGWGLLTVKRGHASILVESGVFTQNSNAECLLMRSAWLASTDSVPKREAVTAIETFLRELQKAERFATTPAPASSEH